MTRPAHNQTFVAEHHRAHAYERLERAEGWMMRLAAPIALLVGAAMAFGLLTAAGHVT